jgi:hypothetical protein
MNWHSDLSGTGMIHRQQTAAAPTMRNNASKSTYRNDFVLTTIQNRRTIEAMRNTNIAHTYLGEFQASNKRNFFREVFDL